MNQARKLVEDFNNYLKDDPRFASYIRTPFFYLMDSNLAEASIFHFGDVAPHPLTPLGFLNGFFKDDVFICYCADDEVRSYAFKLMRIVDGGFIPVGDEEPIKCVTYAEYDKDWNAHVAADPSFVRRVNRWVYEGTTYDFSLSSTVGLLIETEEGNGEGA